MYSSKRKMSIQSSFGIEKRKNGDLELKNRQLLFKNRQVSVAILAKKLGNFRSGFEKKVAYKKKLYS